MQGLQGGLRERFASGASHLLLLFLLLLLIVLAAKRLGVVHDLLLWSPQEGRHQLTLHFPDGSDAAHTLEERGQERRVLPRRGWPWGGGEGPRGGANSRGKGMTSQLGMGIGAEHSAGTAQVQGDCTLVTW